MVMNNKFKYLGKITEKGYWHVIANRGTFAFFLEQEQLLFASIGWENNAQRSLD
jgi:hypothetical protein